jgi:hypothetical protein
MRAREFLRVINEDTGGDQGSSDSPGSDGASTQGDSTAHSARGKVHHYHDTAIPGLTSIPDWPSQYYNMYRMGVHMAGSPENPSNDHGVFSNEMVMTAYTDGEADIINHSAKELGVKLKALSSKHSVETDHTNTVSTVAKPKRNQYGV